MSKKLRIILKFKYVLICSILLIGLTLAGCNSKSSSTQETSQVDPDVSSQGQLSGDNGMNVTLHREEDEDGIYKYSFNNLSNIDYISSDCLDNLIYTLVNTKEEKTMLFIIDTNTDKIVNSLKLDYITSFDNDAKLTKDGYLLCQNKVKKEVQIYDKDLKLTKHFSEPDNIKSDFYLTSDIKAAYYLDNNSILHKIDFDNTCDIVFSSISQLYKIDSIDQLIYDDKVIELRCTSNNENKYIHKFFSLDYETELGEIQDSYSVNQINDKYLVYDNETDSDKTAKLYNDNSVLISFDYKSNIIDNKPAISVNNDFMATVELYGENESTSYLMLKAFSTISGKKTNSVMTKINAYDVVGKISQTTENQGLVFCLNTSDGNNLIYFWKYGNEKEREDINEYKEELSDKYNVDINILADSAADYVDYKSEKQLDKDVVYVSLKITEDVLSKFPDGFMKQIKDYDDSNINIYISGRINCNIKESLQSPIGVTNGYTVILDSRNIVNIYETYFHELMHVIDMKISEQDKDFEGEWNKLNPQGFEYSSSYEVGNADDKYTRNDTTCESPYFIDAYSKSFPQEDRALIFEVLMGMENKPECMYSKNILSKAKLLSDEIKKTFDSSDWDSTEWDKAILDLEKNAN